MDIKKGFAIGVALGFAFGLGCATVATVIPPARAQTSAMHWEYMTIDHDWDDGRWARDADAEGWEFVTVEIAHKLAGHPVDLPPPPALAHVFSMKLRSCLLRLGCRSLRSAFASI